MVMVYREEQLRREAEQIIARKKPVMEEKADLICLLLEHGELLTQQDALFVTHLKHYDIMQAHRKELRRHHLRDCNPDTADLLNLLNHSGTANPGVDSHRPGLGFAEEVRRARCAGTVGGVPGKESRQRGFL